MIVITFNLTFVLMSSFSVSVSIWIS